jgi:small subunit ribosomal protein S4
MESVQKRNEGYNMARYTGPKNRLSRLEGVDLNHQTIGTKSHASLLRRLNVPPGIHGPKGRKKMSGFGMQLREKQKVKHLYGVLERQFRKIFNRAKQWKGHTGDKLLEFLECRLDNCVYRMGISPTRTMARQLVSHGHVMVDGKRMTIPSYVIHEGQIITIKEKALAIPSVKKSMENSVSTVPEWIERKGPAGKIVRLPERSDIKDDINEQLIVEYYSR